MTYRIPRRRWLVATVALLLLTTLVVVQQARADGEDDPSFGTGGVAYSPLAAFTDRVTQPLVDQAPAPDGHIYAAAGTEQDLVLFPTRGVGSTVAVTRLDASGAPSGYGGDGITSFAVGDDTDILDLEALGDGSVILLLRGTAQSSKERGGQAGPLSRVVLDAEGVIDDQQGFEWPEGCENNDNAFLAAAQIGRDPERTYGLYEDCEETNQPVLAEHASDEDTELPDPADDAIDLAIGPDGDVYALAGFQTRFEPGFRGTAYRGAVYRYDAQLNEVAGFNDRPPEDENPKEFGTEMFGHPIDFDVDGQGRPVVWLAEWDWADDRGNGDSWDIQRLQPDGQFDSSWGTDAVVSLQGDAFGRPGCSAGTREQRCTPQTSFIFAQPDGKVLVLGLPAEVERLEQSSSESGPRTIARLTAAGALDTSWDGDGIKTFSVGDEDSVAGTITAAVPALQGDGKVLLPFLAYNNQKLPRAAPPGDPGVSLGVARFGLTPPAQPQAQQAPAPAAAAAPAVPGAAPSLAVKAACKSRRRFTIRLRTGRRKAERSAIVSATVRVNGKKVRVTRTARRTARVNLSSMPKGRFTVTISLRLKDGGTVRETRRYRTCAPKVERELGPLRTRKPRG